MKGRRAVVVLTDGRDENNPGTAPGSTHTFDEVLALGREVQATIYAIALGANSTGRLSNAHDAVRRPGVPL